MDIERIKRLVQQDKYVYSLHADIERKADDLTLAQVEAALLNGTILEHYADTGRGESCLIVGLADEKAVHIVCGWKGDRMAIITVYIPQPPWFIDPWTRGVEDE